MLRFLTPTEEWARRIGNPVTVPVQWPFMLAEISVAEDDAIWMTSAVGVPKSCVKAFFAQGIYLYQFDELLWQRLKRTCAVGWRQNTSRRQRWEMR